MTETNMNTSPPYTSERRAGTIGFPLPGIELRPDGWFVTEDLGQMDADGDVSIVDRAKDLITCDGFNIYPKEMETVLDALPESGVFC